MQKLVFRNGNGVEINLTSSDYGITEWEGFSADELNIQSQQVPFQDGSVFLDALMEQRELNVTLAIQDGNDLQKRYRLRREIISAMNPKLGEGMLIYTNDFLSKQIKVIPQLPIFENHNSNDSGTPKASLSWTACDPYWEDLEEISVPLIAGSRKTVVNEGDVPCGVNIDFLLTYAENPQIKNVTENKKIKLQGNFWNNVKINTNFGSKTIQQNDMVFKINNIGINLLSVTYSKNLDLLVAVGEAGGLYISKDGTSWEKKDSAVTTGTFSFVKYFETKNIFIAVGRQIGGTITSVDGINWQKNVLDFNLNSIAYSESLGIFVGVGTNNNFAVSSDGINWVKYTQSDLTQNYTSVAYSERLNLFVAVSPSGNIIASTDGTVWVKQIKVEYGLTSVIYSSFMNLFVAVGLSGRVCYSEDGINWTLIESGFNHELNDVKFIENLSMFVAVGGDGTILTSKNGINWESIENVGTNNSLSSIIESNGIGYYVAVGNNGTIIVSENLSLWTVISCGVDKNLLYITEAKNVGLVAVGKNGKILLSENGITWTEKDGVNTNDLACVIFVDTLHILVAVGVNKIITSLDNGNTWSLRLSSTMFSGHSVTFSKKLHLFVAVGDNGHFATSEDGLTWNIVSIGNYDVRSVVYSETLQLFVAVGGSGYILTSVDGVNWVQQERFSGDSLNCVIYSEKLQIFITGGIGFEIFTSFDGINWVSRTTRDPNKELRNITFSESLGLFVAVGDNNYAISTNGTLWVEKNFEIVNYRGIGVCYSEIKDCFYTCGFYGVIANTYFKPSENIISSLSADSDMTLSLEVGENELLLNQSAGNLNGVIRYRQKYLGV